jgi:hypothetical protein
MYNEMNELPIVDEQNVSWFKLKTVKVFRIVDLLKLNIKWKKMKAVAEDSLENSFF